MNREILSLPITRDQLRTELQHFVDYYMAKGVASCHVLFGFAWGNEYYPGNEWPEEEVPLKDLVTKADQVEAKGIGKLGSDDLFVKIANMEFQFCHHSDIHIAYFAHSPDVEHFFERWKELGFKPTEWLRNEQHGPGTKVRDASLRTPRDAFALRARRARVRA